MSELGELLNTNYQLVPYLKYARTLNDSDIGKQIRKIKYAYTTTGSPDCGYMDEIYILKLIEYEKHICNICEKVTTMKCEKCKCTYYCNKEHQKKDWPMHRQFCTSNPYELNISKIILEDQEKKLHTINSESWYRKQYFDGWINFDEIKDIKITDDEKKEMQREINMNISRTKQAEKWEINPIRMKDYAQKYSPRYSAREITPDTNFNVIIEGMD